MVGEEAASPPLICERKRSVVLRGLHGDLGFVCT